MSYWYKQFSGKKPTLLIKFYQVSEALNSQQFVLVDLPEAADVFRDRTWYLPLKSTSELIRKGWLVRQGFLQAIAEQIMNIPFTGNHKSFWGTRKVPQIYFS